MTRNILGCNIYSESLRLVILANSEVNSTNYAFATLINNLFSIPKNVLGMPNECTVAKSKVRTLTVSLIIIRIIKLIPLIQKLETGKLKNPKAWKSKSMEIQTFVNRKA